jgi:Tannase and feruloyl esterase
MGTGGASWATELSPINLAYSVSVGYAAVATDGGHISDVADPSAWALSSLGNVNWIALQNFASTLLDKAATIGKAVTTVFYGSPLKHSDWTGCSTGGRQGLQLAKRYPLQYDGILATAPGIYYISTNVALYWAQLVMNQLGLELSINF